MNKQWVRQWKEDEAVDTEDAGSRLLEKIG